MSSRTITRCVLLVLLVAALAACTSKEEKAQGRFNEIRQVETGGNVAEAEALYRQLVEEFPGTPGAALAQKRLVAIRAERIKALRREALPILESVRQVLEGYAAMYGAFPRSLEDLDNGEFFFDSDYLSGAVPEPATLYLLLGAPGGYRAWALRSGDEVGFSVSGGDAGVQTVPMDAALRAIGEAAERARKGNLVVLAGRG